MMQPTGRPRPLPPQRVFMAVIAVSTSHSDLKEELNEEVHFLHANSCCFICCPYSFPEILTLY